MYRYYRKRYWINPWIYIGCLILSIIYLTFRWNFQVVEALSRNTLLLSDPSISKFQGVIVTGANTAYFHALKNLVASIHYWQSFHPRQIIIYDLGLSENRQKEIFTWQWVTLYQSPIKSALKTYTWKPLCIREAVDTYEKVLWIDAGSDVRGSLEPIFEYIDRDGYFFVQGQDENMAPWIHQGMLDYFHIQRKDTIGKYS